MACHHYHVFLLPTFIPRIILANQSGKSVQEMEIYKISSPEMDVNLGEGWGGEHAAPGKNLALSPSSQRSRGPPLQF